MNHFCEQCHQFIVCFTYFLLQEEINLIEKLSQDTDTETITVSVFVIFESLFWHNEAIEITKKTELTEKENENITELNFLCDS